MERLHPWVRGEQNWHSVLKRKGADLSQNLGSWASLFWKWGWRYFSLFWEIHAPVAKEDGSARTETWVERYIGQSLDSFVFELCFYITVQENDWTPFSRHCMRSFPSTTLYSAEECLCNIGALVSVSRMAELKAREGNLPESSPLASSEPELESTPGLFSRQRCLWWDLQTRQRFTCGSNLKNTEGIQLIRSGEVL